MMICKADFEELFPETFRKQEDHPAGGPDAASLSRWEDDGGRTVSLPQRPVASVPKPVYHAGNWPDPRQTGMAMALMPAIATLGAAKAMMSVWGRQARM